MTGENWTVTQHLNSIDDILKAALEDRATAPDLTFARRQISMIREKLMADLRDKWD